MSPELLKAEQEQGGLFFFFPKNLIFKVSQFFPTKIVLGGVLKHSSKSDAKEEKLPAGFLHPTCTLVGGRGGRSERAKHFGGLYWKGSPTSKQKLFSPINNLGENGKYITASRRQLRKCREAKKY